MTLESKAIRPGKVTFVVHNGGKLTHGFELKAESEGHGGDRFKIEARTFDPGETLRIPATLAAGTYEVEC